MPPEDSSDLRERIVWTQLDIDELVETYWEVIAPAMRGEGLDPGEARPTYSWLSAHGFRGLTYALREYHDRSFAEFWEQDLDLAVEDTYDWGIDHHHTIDLLQAFIESRRKRGNLSDSSIDALRSRLAVYVRAYAAVNETSDLLGPLTRPNTQSIAEATDAAWAAFDRLDAERAPRTMRRIHAAVEEWYEHLVWRNRVETNLVTGLDAEYGWQHRDRSGDGPTNPALEPSHVQQLVAATTDATEQVLIMALCAWGLRSSEVAALHQDQFTFGVPNEEVSYIEFTERKNGPGQVSLLYGQHTAEQRIQTLAETKPPWNGYLFASERSTTGHITAQTVRNRFDTLVERAGLPEQIAGQTLVPQMARRFWYDRYTATFDAVLDHVGEIAADQGSASPNVVIQEYLSEARRRQLRRRHMSEQLSAVFEEVV